MKLKKFGVTHTPRRYCTLSGVSYRIPCPSVPMTSSNTLLGPLSSRSSSNENAARVRPVRVSCTITLTSRSASRYGSGSTTTL